LCFKITILPKKINSKEFLGKKKTFLKIIVNYPKAVPFLAKELESLGLDCYEKDILFVHRYLRDANITPMALVQTSGEFVPDKTMRVPVFKVEKIVQATQQTSQKWKILAVDIETYAERKEIDPEKNPILMIAVYGLQHDGSEFKKVLTWKKFPHDFDYVESVADEREMLQRFRDIVVEFQPEIITGYFSDGFDFPYIKTRAERYRLKLDLGLDHSELQIRAGTGFRSSEAKINGLLHLDMLKFIKHIFGMNLKTDSYSLNAVSAELLGHRKHDVNLDNLARIWDNQPEKLPEFCAYNLHDAHLTFKLCAKLLPDIIEFTKIVGVPSYDLIRMRFSRLVENYILKRAMEFNVLAPNKPVGSEMEQRMEEHIQGAFVYEPTPGLYKDVVVFDFRSLYPTIISAHNIGPEALCCSCCQEKAHVPEREDSWFCQAEKKFILSPAMAYCKQKAEAEGLKVEFKRYGKIYRFSKSVLVIENKLCRISFNQNIWNCNRRLTRFYFHCHVSRQKCDYQIVCLLHNSIWITFIFPREVLPAKQMIYIPVDLDRPTHRGPKPAIDWKLYREAWHILRRN